MSCDVGEASEGLANEALLILQPFQQRKTKEEIAAGHGTGFKGNGN